MAYCHFELCRDCGLCFSELLLADIEPTEALGGVVAVVFLYQTTVFYNKTQQYHFRDFILMTKCKPCTRRQRRWQSSKTGRRWGRCSIYRHRL